MRFQEDDANEFGRAAARSEQDGTVILDEGGDLVRPGLPVHGLDAFRGVNLNAAVALEEDQVSANVRRARCTSVISDLGQSGDLD
nr:hypothetical protein [Deinococcus apachensis]